MKVMTLLLIVVFQTLDTSAKVAIIGKGASAGICSYYLHKIIPGIQIDIYDHKPKKKIDVVSRTSIHPNHVYMQEIIQEKRLSFTTTEHVTGTIMILDKNNISLLDFKQIKAKIPKKDKSAFKTLEDFVKQQFKTFTKIYEIQSGENPKSFKTVRQLLNFLSPYFYHHYADETFSYLLENSTADMADIKKYAKAALTINCLVGTDAQAMAGLALLMYSDITGRIKTLLNEVEIFDELVGESDNCLEYDVSEIIRKNNVNYIVRKIDKEKVAYDFIILATNDAVNINFSGFKKDEIKLFNYVQAKTTYVEGAGLLSLFGNLPSSSKTFVDIQNNLTCVYLRGKIYSFLSTKEIKNYDLKRYFQSYKVLGRNVLQRCPDYSKDTNVRDAKFQLSDNLYNALALDSVNMSNEMTAISAKNIAFLIKNKMNGIVDDNPQESFGLPNTSASSSGGSKKSVSFVKKVLPLVKKKNPTQKK